MEFTGWLVSFSNTHTHIYIIVYCLSLIYRISCKGSAWRIIEGDGQGQSVIASNCNLPSVDFQLPIDVHLGTVSIQGWPKLHFEIYAVNFMQNVWPIGYGFVHLPAKPGYHRLEVSTWRIAPNTWFDSIRERFGGGSLVVSKADLIYNGLERYF